LKKGDLGGFENLQAERNYGKRYKGQALPTSFSDWWHSLSRLCENPRTGKKACAAKNLVNQLLPDLRVMLGT
jgi:hypothetical protein